MEYNTKKKTEEDVSQSAVYGNSSAAQPGGSDAVRKAREMLTHQMSQKPGAYQSPWQNTLNDTMQKILNREKFSYDLNGDAMWQQYKDQYIQQGRMAMMDTMGQAAALTGGYGNSYAQQVGQQAYQGYLQGLNDKVPELYQLALERYNQEGTDLYNQLALLSDQENQAYSKYRDQMGDWQDDYDRLYGEYMDQRNYNYQLGRDQAADDQWQAEFDEAKRRYDQEWAKANETASGGSGGSGGSSGGSGGSSGGDSQSSGTNRFVGGLKNLIEGKKYAGADLDELMKAAGSKDAGVRLAIDMADNGVDEDTAFDLYEKYYERSLGGGKTMTGSTSLKNQISKKVYNS